MILMQMLNDYTGAGIIGLLIIQAGSMGVAAIKSMRRNGKARSTACWTPNDIDIVLRAASDSKDAIEILKVKDSDQRPLVYHERGMKEAIDTMHRDIVGEIQKLRRAVERNGR